MVYQQSACEVTCMLCLPNRVSYFKPYTQEMRTCMISENRHWNTPHIRETRLNSLRDEFVYTQTKIMTAKDDSNRHCKQDFFLM